jgi:hypothetical protein
MLKPHFAAVLMLIGIAPTSFAQTLEVGQVTFSWELSTDGGTRWSSGLVEAPEGTPSVLVRARISHSPDAGLFSFISMDPAIRSNAGDFADQIGPGTIPFINGFLATPIRVGPFLKIERGLGDPDLPGVGSAWYRMANSPPNSTPLTPLSVLQFRMTLDGQPGDRVFGQVFERQFGSDDRRIAFRLETSPGTFATNFPTMTVLDTTLRVIPGPGAMGLGMIVGGVVCRRRRRVR